MSSKTTVGIDIAKEGIDDLSVFAELFFDIKLNEYQVKFTELMELKDYESTRIFY